MRILSPLVLLLFTIQLSAQNFTIKSPDQNIELAVTVNNEISWSVSHKSNPTIKKTTIGMNFSKGKNFGENPIVKRHSIKQHSNKIYPGVSHKDAIINNEYVELKISFKNQYQINFRAYNDGVAYQFVDNKKRSRNVLSEQMSVTFPENTKSLFPKEKSLYTHNERDYLDLALTDIAKEDFCSIPVLFTTKKAKVLFTETGLHDYPGMYLNGNTTNTVDAMFPKFVLETKEAKRQPDRYQNISKEADYIAKTLGKRNYPWRIFIISDDDRTFIESNLTYQLSEPSAIKDTSWIKPGKVAWDWYNANILFDVDFKSGLNTKTYKYYIDFAAKNNIEYVILDEGWTKSTTEILDFNPDINVPELIKYGKEKGVELILWVLWKPLDENLDKILRTYQSWGVKGIKVDFMQRSDQYMVNSYERIAKKCADLKLIIDFHGAYKPAGLRRKYPNVLNYEAVRGAENNKWSKTLTPEYNLTIPFIRMAAGPMDYTPGSMNNRQAKNFGISFNRPMSLGTRAHQVAMYVIYEAPLQMLCESPSRYYQEQETVDFIVKIPTAWDETKVLQGKIGDYVAIARKKDEKWYIGAMTDWTERELDINLSFLNDGDYTMEIFKDGINANQYAEDYSTKTITVNKDSKISAKMAKGGGWTAIITKKN